MNEFQQKKIISFEAICSRTSKQCAKFVMSSGGSKDHKVLKPSGLGQYSLKVLGLNVLYNSTELKPKSWLSLFVNTSPVT